MAKQHIFLFITLLGLVTGSFAYMQRTYVSKEIMSLVIDRLDSIERKVDILILERARR